MSLSGLAGKRGDRRILVSVAFPHPRGGSACHQALAYGDYFLRSVAYFYRFYVLYATYHLLLCFAEAYRLGHLFAKLTFFMQFDEPSCQRT